MSLAVERQLLISCQKLALHTFAGPWVLLHALVLPDAMLGSPGTSPDVILHDVSVSCWLTARSLPSLLLLWEDLQNVLCT